MLYRIMYISNAVINFSDEELDALLQKARENNQKRDITGLLIIKGRSFLQCIEGPKENVLEIYSKIEQDNRHESLVKVIEEEDDSRLFPDWSMGYKNFTHLNMVQSEKLKDFSEIDNIRTLSSDVISEVFKEFIEA